MPASAAPPSLVLKYLICAAEGLPRLIVQATIVPARGAASGLLWVWTLTWKPVVRLTARQWLGQLGTVVGEITPTSEIVAAATAGRTSAPAHARRAAYVRLMCPIQHARRREVAVLASFC